MYSIEGETFPPQFFDGVPIERMKMGSEFSRE